MRQCKICGKGSILRAKRLKLRGNYNPIPKTRKYPNLQFTKNPAEVGRILACMKCIKTQKKIKAGK
ncbi:hypothetical protein HZB04_02275 [Candidatus Wolfebacteria bacterium]|nr:hypothetical protein [Candidatus Wolfebacteria bacterium]